MDTIGFIGSGNMAEALIKGITSVSLFEPKNILISDTRAQRLTYMASKYNVTAQPTNAAIATRASIIVLSVKPQNIPQVLQDIKESVRKDSLVISIAAGVKTSDIAAALGDVPIVRAMPNTPALIREGISAIFANKKAVPLLKKAQTIFSSVGEVITIADEDMIDAITAVSGSGPAYYFLLTEAMINAACKLGLAQDVATKLVLQTAKGATLLANQASTNGESPAQLREKVTSPGGVTAAAITVLEKAKFSQLIHKAIEKACQRAHELSK